MMLPRSVWKGWAVTVNEFSSLSSSFASAARGSRTFALDPVSAIKAATAASRP